MAWEFLIILFDSLKIPTGLEEYARKTIWYRRSQSDGPIKISFSRINSFFTASVLEYYYIIYLYSNVRLQHVNYSQEEKLTH